MTYKYAWIAIIKKSTFSVSSSSLSSSWSSAMLNFSIIELQQPVSSCPSLICISINELLCTYIKRRQWIDGSPHHTQLDSPMASCHWVHWDRNYSVHYCTVPMLHPCWPRSMSWWMMHQHVGSRWGCAWVSSHLHNLHYMRHLCHGLWDGKNPEVWTAFECTTTNLFYTRGEEHGIERTTFIESMMFDDLNILIHNDPSQLRAIFKCPLLDDFDGGMEDNLCSILWSPFTLESHVHVNGGGVWVKNVHREIRIKITIIIMNIYLCECGGDVWRWCHRRGSEWRIEHSEDGSLVGQAWDLSLVTWLPSTCRRHREEALQSYGWSYCIDGGMIMVQ